jgi:Domain of unknown function (DUF4390)
MMASTIAYSGKMTDVLWRWLGVAVLCLPIWAQAAEIDVREPQLQANEDGYVLSANFAFELNQRLEEAVTRGVALHFIAEFEMTRPRWYWFDEKILVRSQTYRLSYHALTRQYRLSSGILHQSFTTLDDALQVLSRLRNWQVIDRNDKGFRPVDMAQAALRLRLDIAQLPRPFQINALGNRDWSLSSDWKLWPVTLPAPTGEVR